jgi:predicted molibdopterin-dependent oxidoreductase YjgC
VHQRLESPRACEQLYALKQPLVKTFGRFIKTDWDEAIQLTADRFREIIEKYGPDSIGVLVSAKITNEENYLAQKFTRAVIGTNNVDHCARL